eukprot:jgi/Chlat1/1353/Chrsp119S01777
MAAVMLPYRRVAVLLSLFCCWFVLVAAISHGATAATKPMARVVPLGLDKIRLTPGSLLERAQDLNLQYLLMLEPDRLVANFYAIASLETPALPYGGWEAPDSELRGHFVGHYLSASAMMWQATGNATLKKQMDDVILELSSLQYQIDTGYLSAFPEEFLKRLERLDRVWAPYYTLHKIMAGLVDQYTRAGNGQAMRMAMDMARYFWVRTQRVIEGHRVLDTEFGGIAETLYDLYSHFPKDEYLNLAKVFAKPSFLGPLAIKEDTLTDIHANTHLAQVMSAIKACEVVGDQQACDEARFFLKLLTRTRTYSTGGTNSGEYWHAPHRLGDTLTLDNQEFCTTYNMLKIIRHLFTWEPSPWLAELYERSFWNGVPGDQKEGDPGVMLYYLPLAAGSSKAHQRNGGWGTPFDTMTCCYGTGVESFSKLGEAIYFHDTNVSNIYVNLYIASTAILPNNMSITLATNFPETANATFTISTLKTTPARLHFLHPSWSRSFKLMVNGKAMMLEDGAERTNKHNQPAYASVQRDWRDGDVVSLKLEFAWRFEQIKDDRDTYKGLCSLLYGPVVMVALADREVDLGARDQSARTSWITPVEDRPLRFSALAANGKRFTLMPLYQVQDETYTVYMWLQDSGASSVEAGGRDSEQLEEL